MITLLWTASSRLPQASLIAGWKWPTGEQDCWLLLNANGSFFCLFFNCLLMADPLHDLRRVISSSYDTWRYVKCDARCKKCIFLLTFFYRGSQSSEGGFPAVIWESLLLNCSRLHSSKQNKIPSCISLSLYLTWREDFRFVTLLMLIWLCPVGSA